MIERRIQTAVLVVLSLGALVWGLGVILGYWPYMWWEMFR